MAKLKQFMDKKDSEQSTTVENPTLGDIDVASKPEAASNPTLDDYRTKAGITGKVLVKRPTMAHKNES